PSARSAPSSARRSLRRAASDRCIPWKAWRNRRRRAPDRRERRAARHGGARLSRASHQTGWRHSRFPLILAAEPKEAPQQTLAGRDIGFLAGELAQHFRRIVQEPVDETPRHGFGIAPFGQRFLAQALDPA